MDFPELKVGRTYRAHKPAQAGSWLSPEVNDRTILHIGIETLQYDGPSVKHGAKYPSVTIAAFLKWAASDVTDQLPEGRYASWPIKKEGE